MGIKERIGGAIKCLWRGNHGPTGVSTPVSSQVFSQNVNECFDSELWTGCWFHIGEIWIKVTSKLPYFKWERSKRRLKRKYVNLWQEVFPNIIECLTEGWVTNTEILCHGGWIRRPSGLQLVRLLFFKISSQVLALAFAINIRYGIGVEKYLL